LGGESSILHEEEKKTNKHDETHDQASQKEAVPGIV
jgi:hypothetical protein